MSVILRYRVLGVWLLIAGWLAACMAPATLEPLPLDPIEPTATATATFEPFLVDVTPLPTREMWLPNEPLPYTSQPGDWLPALTYRFGIEAEVLLAANPTLQVDQYGLIDAFQPMIIPAHYAPLPGLAGSPLKLIPDSEFVYGPDMVGWRTADYLATTDGWLRTHVATADGAQRSAAEIIDRVALRYSVNPRLLLALIEHQSGLVTGMGSDINRAYPLGYQRTLSNGLHRQLLWAVEVLNTGYYSWREGRFVEITLRDGRASRIDPWQNAGTVGVHYFFAQLHDRDGFTEAVDADGFLRTYYRLFGDPFQYEVALFPPGSQQPELMLPFLPGKVWSYTGGPHPAWGSGIPWSAVDFAPPAVATGCSESSEWVTAMADGVVVRSGENTLVLDLDGDGSEATGWTIFYFHLASKYTLPVGTVLAAGDPLGHPSCEGGRSTGTHVHVARKFNGEWIAADGMLPFMLSGWQVHAGSLPYQGRMTFELPAMEIVACECVSTNTLSR